MNWCFRFTTVARYKITVRFRDSISMFSAFKNQFPFNRKKSEKFFLITLQDIIIFNIKSRLMDFGLKFCGMKFFAKTPVSITRTSSSIRVRRWRIRERRNRFTNSSLRLDYLFSTVFFVIFFFFSKRSSVISIIISIGFFVIWRTFDRSSSIMDPHRQSWWPRGIPHFAWWAWIR